MSQIMKAFTGIFVLLFMMSSATGILGVFFQTVYAQNLHAVIIDELENSDYTYSVVKDAFVAAEDSGYELEVKLYQKRDEIIICGSEGSVPSDLSDVYMAEVTLTYPIELAFFHLNQTQQLIGYAR